MPIAVVVVLALALLGALAAVVVLVRRRPAGSNIDEASIRRLLAETIGQQFAGGVSQPQAVQLDKGVGREHEERSLGQHTSDQLGDPQTLPGAAADSEVTAGHRSEVTAAGDHSGAAVSGDQTGPARHLTPIARRDVDASRDATDHSDRTGTDLEMPVAPTPVQLDHLALAELRQEATQVAAEIRRAAGEAAEGLRERSRADADRLRVEARADADQTISAARAEAADLRAGIQAERARLAREAADALSAEKVELQQAQQRLRVASTALTEDQQSLAGERERIRADRLDIDSARSVLDSRDAVLREQAAELAQQVKALEARAVELDNEQARQQAELSRVAGLTVQAARTELLAGQEEAVRRDAAFMIRRIETEALTDAKSRARAIVAEAIQRVASDQTAQTVVSVVHLPAEEVKGRIIGREGRNIRTFETVTGVNVIIDDTPEAVLLSCFDPVRREIGRITLQMLIDDGRIHPHRIEEAFERAGDEVEALCRRAAEDALLDVGITDLHPELVKLVGRLKYRTSYGQNVLGHLVETSHIARLLASELGVDPKVVARGAFLHDIGKALTHEAQGSHAIVGAELARRYGESEDVAHCIEAHHDEVLPTTVEAVLTQAADSCSGGRPGARRESLESYVQRLEKIELIASAKKGVEKVFAMQAGRELRVMVKPEVVDDLEAHVLAREVAKQIEEELTYPGQVRVTVIRESRATEIAR